MAPNILRPLLVLVFLVAMNCWLTFWNIVGGAYHLELMEWPWKFGLSMAMAGLLTKLAAVFAAEGKPNSATVWRLVILMGLVMAVAGGVTYYTHLNEPTDEDDTSDSPSITRTSASRMRREFRASLISASRLDTRNATRYGEG
jgi:hypothetical protein